MNHSIETPKVKEIASIGEHIGYAAGELMVKRFYDRHPDQAYGHIIGREIIEAILAQPNCEGIVALPAYNDQGFRQIVLVGLDGDKNPILKYSIVNTAGEIVSEEGLIADRYAISGWQ